MALLVLKLKQLGFSFSIWPGVNTQLGNYAIILREFIRLQENCETNGYFHKTDHRLLWNLEINIIRKVLSHLKRKC